MNETDLLQKVYIPQERERLRAMRSKTRRTGKWEISRVKGGFSIRKNKVEQAWFGLRAWKDWVQRG